MENLIEYNIEDGNKSSIKTGVDSNKSIENDKKLIFSNLLDYYQKKLKKSQYIGFCDSKSFPNFPLEACANSILNKKNKRQIQFLYVNNDNKRKISCYYTFLFNQSKDMRLYLLETNRSNEDITTVIGLAKQLGITKKGADQKLSDLFTITPLKYLKVMAILTLKTFKNRIYHIARIDENDKVIISNPFTTKRLNSIANNENLLRLEFYHHPSEPLMPLLYNDNSMLLDNFQNPQENTFMLTPKLEMNNSNPSSFSDNNISTFCNSSPDINLMCNSFSDPSMNSTNFSNILQRKFYQSPIISSPASDVSSGYSPISNSLRTSNLSLFDTPSEVNSPLKSSSIIDSSNEMLIQSETPTTSNMFDPNTQTSTVLASNLYTPSNNITDPMEPFTDLNTIMTPNTNPLSNQLFNTSSLPMASTNIPTSTSLTIPSNYFSIEASPQLHSLFSPSVIFPSYCFSIQYVMHQLHEKLSRGEQILEIKPSDIYPWNLENTNYNFSTTS